MVYKRALTGFLFSLFLGLVNLLIIGSCQKREDTAAPQEQSALSLHPVFKKTVGAPISGETGRRWVANLRRKSRGEVPSFIVESEEFTALISDSSCVGICLYYIQNEAGETHLALIGVDASGTVMQKTTVATDAGAVDWTVFQAFRKAYKAANPGGIEAHFFGTKTFLRLIEEQQAAQIKATKALNDADQPQLLLSDAALTEPESSEDASIVCPPTCLKGI